LYSDCRVNPSANELIVNDFITVRSNGNDQLCVVLFGSIGSNMARTTEFCNIVLFNEILEHNGTITKILTFYLS
jgi:hypothetical protein